MNDAINNPVTRKYERKAVHTDDMPIAQKADIDISLDAKIVHGESIPNISGDHEINASYMAELAFMEEPVTIIIENNGNDDFPETHVPVYVQGRAAEVLQNGRWLEIGWLPINVEITTKRKYVEVLARSKADSIKTMHQDATVERPQNHIRRNSKSNYPMSILQDDNPRGREWLSRIRMGH